jgi:hypothetical protein
MKQYKKSRRNKRSRRGGSASSPFSGTGVPTTQTPNYNSGHNWMMDTVGSANTQYKNVFGPETPYSDRGNSIVGLQGQVAGKSRKRRKRRGGNLGQVINQAIVPFGLLGLQQSFRRKKGSKGGKSKRRR